MSEQFEKPRRQAPLGILVLFALNLRRFVQIIIAIVASSTFSKDIDFSISAIVSIGIVALAIISFLQYLRFTFYIKNGEFVLEKGILKRERLVVPLERIQSVELNQNLVQQVVRLTGLKIDTAGSGKEELVIRALKRSDAEALQQYLEQYSQSSATVDDQAEGEAIAIPQVKSKRELLVELSIKKLLVVGMTQNHIRNGFVALFFVFGLFNRFNDSIYDKFADSVEANSAELESFLAVSGIAFALIAIILFIIGSIIISLVRTLLTYYNFKATLGDDTLRISAGLLKRNEQSIPLNKIQILKWKSNFLRKIPGFESAVIQASRSKSDSKTSQAEIPACYEREKVLLEQALFPGFDPSGLFHFKPHPFYRTYMGLGYSIFALVFGFIIGQQTHWSFGIAAGIFGVVVAFFFASKRYSKIKISTDGHFLRQGKGWAFSEKASFLTHKIQSIEFRQSIFQKRRGTAHLKLHTAGGSMILRFLPAQLASELHNYLLYRVETSTESWM